MSLKAMSMISDFGTFTVSELVARLGARSERQADLWLRRVRHWSTFGLLDPVGLQHTGSGRHRQFGVEALYVAAVLMRLADRGLPVGVLRLIASGLAKSLKGPDAEYARLWEAAKRRPKRPIFIAFQFEPDDESALTTESALVQILEGDGLLIPRFSCEGDAMEVLDLTAIFGRVKP
jgi:hypothetical protein